MFKTGHRALLAATLLFSFVNFAHSAAIPSRSFEFKGDNAICSTNRGSCLSGGNLMFDFTIAGTFISNGMVSENSTHALKRLMLVDFYRPLNFPPYPSTNTSAKDIIWRTSPYTAPTESMEYSFFASGLNTGAGQESDDYLLSFSASRKSGLSILQVSFMATPDQWFLHTQEGNFFYNYSGTISHLTERPVPAVPLPGSLPLLLSGLAGLLAVRRR